MEAGPKELRKNFQYSVHLGAPWAMGLNTASGSTAALYKPLTDTCYLQRIAPSRDLPVINIPTLTAIHLFIYRFIDY
jgi:hypothetical protein